MNRDKVLKEIYEKPSYKFHIRELAKLTKLNPNTIVRITDLLVKDGIIIKEKRKNLSEVWANLEDQRYLLSKRLFNILALYSSGLVDCLIKTYRPSSIVLMGSFSRGEDLEGSDIDLVVTSKTNKRINLDKYSGKLGREIQLLLVDEDRLSKEFVNNVANGIVLEGYFNIK